MDTDILTFFIPLKPMNLKNTSGHWSVRYRYSKALREATATLGKEAMRKRSMQEGYDWWWNPFIHKRIHIVASLPRRYDVQDGLPASMAPVVDGLQLPRDVEITRGKRKGQTTHLVGCGLIDHDGVESGHIITYDQVVRKPWGVTVAVRPRE